MLCVFHVTRNFIIGLFLLVLMCQSAAAQTTYTIEPGDRLSISFISNSSFDKQLSVDINGSIFLPIIGELNVQGQTISEIRSQVAKLMTGAVFRERVDGEYLLIPIEPADVIMDVAEYRPIYFDGAVARPGRQSFSIGMNVRQGIAAAEGLLVADRVTRGSELRNHPRVLMADLVGILAEIAVLEAMLAGTEELNLAELRELDAPSELVEDAILLAISQVATSGELLNAEISFLDTAVDEAESRIFAAMRHEEAMREIAENEQAEVDRVEGLVARRAIASDALTDARRFYLQAVERFSDVQSERLAAEETRRELVLERNQAKRERAVELQARLQALSQQAAQLRVRIELSAASANDLTLAAPKITVFRSIGGQLIELEAAPETPLFPGDVVNVSIGE